MNINETLTPKFETREAGWQKRPFYPSSNILGRLPNAVAITGNPPIGAIFRSRCNLVNKRGLS